MKQYADVSEVPAEWLGKLPTHWGCKKIGSLFIERKTKVSDKEYEPLSVAKIGVVPQLAHAAKSNAGDNRKLVCKGDFVINSRSDRKGSCGISPLNGSVSLINIVLTPKHELNEKYVHYLLRSQPFSEEFYRRGRGIVADLWTTRYSEMKDIVLPLPPFDEQCQIAHYLDWQVSNINKLISYKQQQIIELKELMKVEIEKQLSRFKIEKTVRLKQLGSFFKGGGFSRDNLVSENNYPAILYGDIYTQYEYKTSIITHFIDKDAYNDSRKITKGDIVMAGTGETKEEIGKSILYQGDAVVAVGGDVIVFHPYQGINTEYLLYQLYSASSLKHRYINGKGDIIVHIYSSALGNTIIPLPEEKEQIIAVKEINAIIDKVKKAVNNLNDEITVLREYRVRLIADIVTGKFDTKDVQIPDFDFVEELIEHNDVDCEDIETEQEE